jgi:predicted 3-demethylubiquinone-9 3-methyltransferase (glyoxalase superfamily)
MQKITPFLWFDDNAEEAMNLYTSLFHDGEITSVNRIGGEDAAILTGSFRIGGLEISVMNAGPEFTFTPSVSFYVTCESADEIEKLWNGLVEGGGVLMPLDNYPFAERYGWLADRFGVSWQLIQDGTQRSVTPFLMYVGDQFGRAEEAMRLYTSVFPDSGIDAVAYYEEGQPDAGKVVHGKFRLAGQPFIAMESGLEHQFNFSEANSFFVACDTQEEVDRYWNALIANGGEESMCGWLKDPFGVSWQIIPNRLMELMADEDREKAGRVQQAMFQMRKIDVAALEEAYSGNEVTSS